MDSNGHAEWRQLEDRKAYVGLPNRHEALGSTDKHRQHTDHSVHAVGSSATRKGSK